MYLKNMQFLTNDTGNHSFQIFLLNVSGEGLMIVAQKVNSCLYCQLDPRLLPYLSGRGILICESSLGCRSYINNFFQSPLFLLTQTHCMIMEAKEKKDNSDKSKGSLWSNEPNNNEKKKQDSSSSSSMLTFDWNKAVKDAIGERKFF